GRAPASTPKRCLHDWPAHSQRDFLIPSGTIEFILGGMSMQPSAIAAQPGIAVPPSDRADSAAGISARMDRLPTTRHLWVLVLLLSLGGWFEIYDLIFTGYIAPGLAKSGLLATTTETFFGPSKASQDSLRRRSPGFSSARFFWAFCRTATAES